MVEVLNLPTSILSGCGNVKNMLVKPKIDILLQYFDEVDVHDMHQGDLCIWGGSSNHIAIFDHWDGVRCWYFSQNPNKCQVMAINMSGLRAFRKKVTKPVEAVDQIIHKGSKVQIPGTFEVISVRKSDNTSVVRINGVDYRLSSTPLLEVE